MIRVQPILLASSRNPKGPGSARGSGSIPPSSGGQPPQRRLLLSQLPAEFRRMLSVPPERAEFRHTLQFRLANEVYQAGKPGICALARLLEAEVWFSVEGSQQATRTDIFTVLTDATRPEPNEVAQTLDREGFPFNGQFQMDILDGMIPLSNLNIAEQPEFAAAFQSFPPRLDALYYFYFLNQGTGEVSPTEALKHYNIALLINPEIDHIYFRIIARKDIDPDLKNDYLDLLSAVDPENPLIVYYKGAILIENGEFESAIAHFEAALQDYSQPFVLCIELGKVYHQTGRSRKALEYFERAIKEAPDHPVSTHAYLNASSIFAQQLKFGGALRYSEKAIELAPPSSQVWIFANTNKAFALHNLGRVREAIQTARIILGEEIPEELLIPTLIQLATTPPQD